MGASKLYDTMDMLTQIELPDNVFIDIYCHNGHNIVVAKSAEGKVVYKCTFKIKGSDDKATDREWKRAIKYVEKLGYRYTSIDSLWTLK